MSIMTNKAGDVLLRFDRVAEEEAARFEPFTHALIVVRHNDQYLLGWNQYRQGWEIAGGGIETGETPRECAIRELFEETGQIAENVEFCGVMKLRLQPDQRIEYGALFAGTVHEVKPFAANHEIGQLILWDGTAEIGYVNEIDVAYIGLA